MRKLGTQLESDNFVIQAMKLYGIPITRENYIKLAYIGEPPEEWGAELEAELPEALQITDEPRVVPIRPKPSE